MDRTIINQFIGWLYLPLSTKLPAELVTIDDLIKLLSRNNLIHYMSTQLIQEAKDISINCLTKPSIESNELSPFWVLNIKYFTNSKYMICTRLFFSINIYNYDNAAKEDYEYDCIVILERFAAHEIAAIISLENLSHVNRFDIRLNGLLELDDIIDILSNMNKICHVNLSDQAIVKLETIIEDCHSEEYIQGLEDIQLFLDYMKKHGFSHYTTFANKIEDIFHSLMYLE